MPKQLSLLLLELKAAMTTASESSSPTEKKARAIIDGRAYVGNIPCGEWFEDRRDLNGNHFNSGGLSRSRSARQRQTYNFPPRGATAGGGSCSITGREGRCGTMGGGGRGGCFPWREQE